MGVFEMVVALVLIGTAGKVAQTAFEAFSRSPDPGAQERLRALEAELRASEARLAHTEERVNDLAEKLDFVESLLAAPERRTELPPPPR